MAEDEDVEDVEEDAKEADDHRKVQVDVVVEILPKNTQKFHIALPMAFTNFFTVKLEKSHIVGLESILVIFDDITLKT